MLNRDEEGDHHVDAGQVWELGRAQGDWKTDGQGRSGNGRLEGDRRGDREGVGSAGSGSGGELRLEQGRRREGGRGNRQGGWQGHRSGRQRRPERRDRRALRRSQKALRQGRYFGEQRGSLYLRSGGGPDERERS